jgi:hypothetical protein
MRYSGMAAAVLLAAVAALGEGTAQVSVRLRAEGVGAVQWREAVASSAALPACDAAALGHVRVALDAGTAHLCNGAAWVELAGGGGAFVPAADPAVDHSGYVAGHGDGTDCGAGLYARGTDAAGNATGCTADDAGTDTLDDLSDNQIGDLLDVDETGAGAGEALVSDGAGAWAPSAAAAILEGDSRLTDARAPTDDSVDADSLADGDLGDVSVSGGVVTVDDESIAATELADGTAGNLLTWDASGEAAAVATGTSGQVLTSAGAGAPPTFEDAAGGGANPAGSGSELQYRSDATTFGAVTGSSVTGGADVTLGGVLSVPVGSMGTPSIAFAGDPDTGIYQSTGNRLTIGAGGGFAAEFLSAANFGVMANYHRAPGAGASVAILRGTGLSLGSGASIGWNSGNADSMSPDIILTRAAAGALAVSGALVNTPASRTCADSGDGSPGALTVTVSGATNLYVTSSDPDGCTLTLSETSASDGQLLELELVATAGGVVTLADTPGTQNLSAAWTPGVGDSLTLRYNLTASEWRERARADI